MCLIKSNLSNISLQHHCRKCGAVVCAGCSSKKFLLPSISSKPLRVCDGCYQVLSANNSSNEDQKPTSGNHQISSPSQPKPSKPKTSKSLNVKSVLSSKNNRKIIPNDTLNTDLDEITKEAKEIEQKEFVEFNNKHLSVIREESVEEGVPKTPPTTPVANYPKPLPLVPNVSIEIDPPKPTVEKMFSVDIIDEDLFKKDLEEMPQIPTEEPEIEIKPRNPQLYQLCQMNSNASFWWDQSEDSNDDFGLNFRSDGVPFQPSATTLSPNHPQLTASESVTSYYFEEKGMLLAPFQCMGVTKQKRRREMSIFVLHGSQFYLAQYSSSFSFYS